MNYLDQTLPTPAENLACDEALAESCEQGGPEVLRFWEAREWFVVVGYANKQAREANLAACAAAGVPVYRRPSGGGTVLQGPGCLNYTLILKVTPAGSLASIASANRFIMERQAAALATVLGQPVHVQGHTDLTLGDHKFSGNAQRRFRNSLLFHGTFLLNFDLTAIHRFLPPPSQQPAYRLNRGHADFVVNLPLDAAQVKAALCQAWGASEPLAELPRQRIDQLAREKYSQPEWNEKF
ncbi:MAG: lipoate--protein ligase family protein [Verrucomicrobiota bacterium]